MFKDITDACMSFLNEDTFYDVFIKPDQTVVVEITAKKLDLLKKETDKIKKGLKIEDFITFTISSRAGVMAEVRQIYVRSPKEGEEIDNKVYEFLVKEKQDA